MLFHCDRPDKQAPDVCEERKGKDDIYSKLLAALLKTLQYLRNAKKNNSKSRQKIKLENVGQHVSVHLEPANM